MEDEDQGLYTGVRWTLIAGMIVSFGLMGVGLLGLIGDPQAATRAAQVIPLDHLIPALLAADPGAALDLGVLALMAIPVVHLTVALGVFLRGRETRYAAAAGLVLLLLLGSALLALHAP
jgi:uncharacterized membrane protein